MAQEANSECTDTEIKRIEEKTAKGAINVVASILENPGVQKTIKDALVRETVKQAAIMSCLFIGILNLYGVAKQVIGFGWQTEAIISTILVLIALIYMLKNIFTGKKHAK